MHRIIEIVYKILLKEIGENTIQDKSKFVSGISSYITKEGLADLEDVDDDVVLRKLLSDFISPAIKNMPSESTYLYFAYYDELCEYHDVSKAFGSLARKKATQGNVDNAELEKMQQEFLAIINKLYAIPGMKKMIENDVSECILDNEYIKSDSKEISMRLSHYLESSK